MKWDEINDKEGDVRSVILTVNEQYVLMNLALLMLQAPSLFITDIDESNTEEINDFINALIYSVMNEEIPPPVLGAMGEVNCWAHEAQVITGSAMTIGVNTGQLHNVLCSQTTPALNNKVRWTRYLAAGDYSFSFLYARNTGQGVIDIYITPPTAGTLVILNNADLRGSLLLNQFQRGTFTLTESGKCEIEIEVVATSLGSNYNNQFTLLQLWRTDT